MARVLDSDSNAKEGSINSLEPAASHCACAPERMVRRGAASPSTIIPAELLLEWRPGEARIADSSAHVRCPARREDRRVTSRCTCWSALIAAEGGGAEGVAGGGGAAVEVGRQRHAELMQLGDGAPGKMSGGRHRRRSYRRSLELCVGGRGLQLR